MALVDFPPSELFQYEPGRGFQKLHAACQRLRQSENRSDRKPELELQQVLDYALDHHRYPFIFEVLQEVLLFLPSSPVVNLNPYLFSLQLLVGWVQRSVKRLTKPLQTPELWIEPGFIHQDFAGLAKKLA